MSSKEISPSENSSTSNIDFLSEYDLRGIIGKGTFSVVKLGENKKTKEKVAIKILQKNKITSKDDLIRIDREIEILKRLKHPNVIKIYRIEEDQKNYYIIMEFCENGELFNRIVRKQHLTEDEASLFYYQLINGLEYIHKNNIVHRDLKPENLLLSKNDLLKIIDFGLSNYTQCDYLLATPCGSPCYASPEMVSGQMYNGYMIDVWSTGIILFAMVCGYLPFEDNDNEILFGKILKCKINYPKIMGKLTLDLMKRIITPDPKKRITLEQIKVHPFYLKGKKLFSQRYPELINEVEGINKNNLNNNNIKEIIIKNVTPIIKSNVKKSIEENKQKKEQKDKTTNVKYKPLQLNEISNSYIPYIPETITATNNIINIPNIPINSKTNKIIQNNNNTTIEIVKPAIKTIEKKNIDKNNRLETNTSLNSDEIPKDSVPKDYTEKKKDNINNISSNIKEEKDKFDVKNLQEHLNTINLTDQNNRRIYKIYKTKKEKVKESKSINKINNNTNNKLKQVVINLGDNNSNINRNRTIEKDKKINNNDIKRIISPKNKLDHKTFDNLYLKEKVSNTIDTSTTIVTKMDYYYNTNTAETQRNNDNKKNNKIPKTTYLNYKMNPVYDTITKKEIKNNLNTEDKNKNKIPHNNYSKLVKINNTFAKKIQRKPIYNKNNITDRNNRTNIENINLTNINNKSNINTKIPNLNYFSYDTNKTTINDQNNNNNINNIFNNIQLIHKNKKTIVNVDNNNSSDIYSSYNRNIKEKIINMERPLKLGKTLIQIQNKGMKHNNYIDIRNTYNFYPLKEYQTYEEKKQIIKNNMSKPNKITNQLINQDKYYLNNNNTQKYQGVSQINDKYFDTITINNNNNINLHEPKLYIYVENNNNNNTATYQRLRTESNPNKIKKIFKFTKNNNNTSKIRNININKITPSEYDKNILNKTTNPHNIIENKTIEDNKNNINNKQRYHKITPVKNKQNNSNNNKIYYNSIEPVKKVYTFKVNNNDLNKRIKDDNVKYIINRKNNNNFNDKTYYYFNGISMKNNLNNNDIAYISNTSNIIEKDNINKNYNKGYYNKSMHDLIKSEINLELWNNNNQRTLENNDNFIMNNYFYDNPQFIARRKNISSINSNNLINKSDLALDNIDYKIKLQKMQNKNYISFNNNNDNIKNISIPIIKETNNYMYPINNYKKINTILTNNTKTPVNKHNYKIISNFKKM